MPPFSSRDSPSLQKMNAMYEGGRRRRGAPTFSFARLVDRPRGRHHHPGQRRGRLPQVRLVGRRVLLRLHCRHDRRGRFGLARHLCRRCGGLPRRRAQLHHPHHQQPRLPIHRRATSRGRRLHSPVHDLLHLDLVLRLDGAGQPPGLHRLVRAQQGAAHVDAAQPAAERQPVRAPAHHRLGPAPAADVHLGPAQRLRDLVPGLGLPGRPHRRAGSQRLAAALRRARRGSRRRALARALADRRAPSPGRRRRRRWGRGAAAGRGCRRAHRVPLPRQGHLLVRGEPGRRQRDQLRQARDPRGVGRQRPLVAGQEGERRDGHRALELPHPVMRNGRSKAGGKMWG